MEQLRGQSPDMAGKEIPASRVAHELILCLIAESIAIHHVDMRRVNFNGSLDA